MSDDLFPVFDDFLESSKHWHKFEFREEIDNISSSDLSTEMKLVLEYLVLFQWVEYEAKQLLWFLYGATSAVRSNIYMNDGKKKDIFKLNTQPLIKELSFFSIDEDGYRKAIIEIAKSLEKLSKKRNKIAHNLFSEKLDDKSSLVKELEVDLAELKRLETTIQKLSVPINSIAAEVEIAGKRNNNG
ncbi:MAG: hypothetical protein U0491_01540 [Candidatus Saccharimonadales bacterium]